MVRLLIELDEDTYVGLAVMAADCDRSAAILAAALLGRDVRIAHLAAATVTEEDEEDEEDQGPAPAGSPLRGPAHRHLLEHSEN